MTPRTLAVALLLALGAGAAIPAPAAFAAPADVGMRAAAGSDADLAVCEPPNGPNGSDGPGSAADPLPPEPPSLSVPSGQPPAATPASGVAPPSPLAPTPAAPFSPSAAPAPLAPAAPVAGPAPPAPARRPQGAAPVAPTAPLSAQPMLPPGPIAAALPAVEGRTYTPGTFQSIEIAGSASVRFVQSPVDDVFVEGDEDVQRAIGLVVRDGKLVIDQNGAWKFWRAAKPRILVRARELTRVVISGAADFTVDAPLRVPRLAVRISGAGSARLDQLDVQALEFVVDGAGDGTVAGAARDLKVRISGHSGFQGEDLRVERGSVSISGVGKVRVWARQDLDIAVAGVGRVEYWGTPPVVRRQVSGAAQITDRGAKGPVP